MAQELFSSSLTPFSGVIENPALQDSLNEIFAQPGIGEPKLYEWAKGSIALAITVKVELPSLGNHDDLDIQPLEPILIVFALDGYPAKAPLVLTDRLSFPKDKLAHLYIAVNGKPPAFCLVRGSFPDWYATKRPTDLLIRIGNWLRDAATGNLTEDGGQFDPMRLEKFTGTLIYDYDQLANIVNGKQSFLPGSNFAILLFKRSANTTYKLVKPITDDNYLETLKQLAEAQGKAAKDLKTDHYHVGYLVWGDDEKNYGQYLIDIPRDWEQIKKYAGDYGISLDAFESYVTEKDVNSFKGVPLILAIRRPLQVIGFSQNIEFSNHLLVLDETDKSEGKIINNISALFSSHKERLTQRKARLISGQPILIKKLSLILGCGALGSKIVMHLARGGNNKLALVDPDKIAPHNMVRHALLGEQVGLNKAAALIQAIQEIYPEQSIDMADISALADPTLQGAVFNDLEWLFDFTASESVFNTIVNATNLITPRICRANISDRGKLGVMLLEGADRNPRLDDLQVSLMSMYDSSAWVRKWLTDEQSHALDSTVSISVGVGCNSETTILSDDTISSHAAFFTGAIKREMTKSVKSGKIFINRIIEDGDYKIETDVLHIAPFGIYTANNDPSWSIRIRKGIIDKITSEMIAAGESETGGVFVGIVNYKTKTIHVTGIIDAPPDSSANEVCFHRGHQGLPDKIDEITVGSGNQLGYIGEWHSHPNGPNGLSAKDLKTVSDFKVEFQKLTTPLPVFLMVVTPNGVLPYVY